MTADPEPDEDHRPDSPFAPRLLTVAEGNAKATYLFWYYLEMLWFKRNNRGRYNWMQKGRDE